MGCSRVVSMILAPSECVAPSLSWLAVVLIVSGAITRSFSALRAMAFALAQQKSLCLPPVRHNSPHNIHRRPSLVHFERQMPDRATDRTRQSPSHVLHTTDRLRGDIHCGSHNTSHQC